MRDKRLLWVLASAAAIVVLFVVLRPDDDEGGNAAATTAAPATTASGETETDPETETAPATTTAPPEPEVITVRLSVRGGTPVGGIARPSVRQGRRVRIVVRSDVADHVHLHGYDIMRDVAPGQPAQIVFDAAIPGRFEIELEDRRLQLAELEVRP